MKTGNETEAGNSEALAAALAARLCHVTDGMPGLRRERDGEGFRYLTADGQPAAEADVARIRALAIPPAWEDVWICPKADGHLQATGRDARGRKQYRYHTRWQAVRTQDNFDSMLDFAHALPRIRRHIARDLRRKGIPREKVLAAVVAIMERTHIRVGNEKYAEDNRSFGLSTLRDRHVDIRGARLRMSFRGKSGKFHRIALDNKRLARIVKHCRDLPGYQVFQYLDDKGEARDVTSDAINDYLREIAGAEFTAKDFRTWAGTTLATEILGHHDGDENEEPVESAVLTAYDEVAAALGNTRAVCRKHYIHPAICEAYLDGTLPSYFDSGGAPASLKPAERAVVRLLKKLARKRAGSRRARRKPA